MLQNRNETALLDYAIVFNNAVSGCQIEGRYQVLGDLLYRLTEPEFRASTFAFDLVIVVEKNYAILLLK